jgi:putative aminopeptidase FrvX
VEVKARANQYENACADYLRDIVRIPSVSGNEKEVALRIKQELEKLQYDRVWIDDYGNVIGQIGNGPLRLVYG